MNPTKRQMQATQAFKLRLAEIMAKANRPDSDKWAKAAKTLRRKAVNHVAR